MLKLLYKYSSISSKRAPVGANNGKAMIKPCLWNPFVARCIFYALPKTWILSQDSWCKQLTRGGRHMAGLAFLCFIPPHTFIAVLVNCRPTVLSVKRRSRNDVDRLNSGEWRYQLKTLLMWLWQVRTMTMMTRITMMTTMTMTKKWKWVMECGDVC